MRTSLAARALNLSARARASAARASERARTALALAGSGRERARARARTIGPLARAAQLYGLSPPLFFLRKQAAKVHKNIVMDPT